MEPKDLSIDLNHLKGWQYPEFRDNSCVSGHTRLLYRNHKRWLLKLLEEARVRGWVCFGCMAWLTDYDILEGLARIPCSIIVQKGDLWRPDLADGEKRGVQRARVRRQYEAIGRSDRTGGKTVGYFQRQHMPWPLGQMSQCADPAIAGVRSFGISTGRSAEAPLWTPLMHNKFVVFAELVLKPGAGSSEEDPWEVPEWQGRVLWTGSLNLTRLSRRSCETALIFRDPVFADAAIREWAQIAALSEPLEWTSEWINPQWRLGS